METRAIDFVRYTVSDFGTALPFYRDALGLELERHVEEYGWAEFALPPTTLALDETDDAERTEPTDRGGAVALAVDDVERAVEELRADGTTVLQDPFETDVCDIATVADPDGNPIVLHRRHDGTAGRTDPLP
ncbi:VOC family protein [Halovivax limisalsi]|uniref:VOC family protein n=1 Tax=Halovivax limisalsi TaxID=1453760 RepID=UPI001FFD5DF1|nr:VOC family protein [Halovivax limisalsi]